MQRFMHYLRKNAGMVTAVSGVVLMFAWVIIPPLEQAYDMYSGSGVQVDTVLTWREGTVSQNQLYAMRSSHDVAVAFLRLDGCTRRSPVMQLRRTDGEWRYDGAAPQFGPKRGCLELGTPPERPPRG